uniref:Uncharacterized protein n=1 Tax=Anopheles melas TaxID=34690 RepID=A0A182U9N5_9DIPT
MLISAPQKPIVLVVVVVVFHSILSLGLVRARWPFCSFCRCARIVLGANRNPFSLLYTSPRLAFPNACPLGGSGGVLFVSTYNSLYDVHTVSSVGQKVLHEKVLEM